MLGNTENEEYRILTEESLLQYITLFKMDQAND